MSRSANGKFPAMAFASERPHAAARLAPELDPPFDILQPDRSPGPIVLSSPHSGDRYPAAFLASAKLSPFALRRSEDAHVDRLFAGGVGCGAPLIRALFPRAYLDVNREPYELDPRMFDGRLPPFANTRSVRVAGGLGTIARVVGESQEIYSRRLPVAEAILRIEALYKPYHRALRGLFQSALAHWGCAILVDCHSMPSACATERDLVGARADIVIGDRYGTSCHPAISDALESTLSQRGYLVRRNNPYAGGFITEHFGNPCIGAHAVQVEVNRGLYLDEKTLDPTAGATDVARDLTEMVRALDALARSELAVRRAAAE